MDDRIKNLWADLEAYIQENWIAPDEEMPAAKMLYENESPDVVKHADLFRPIWKREEGFDKTAYREKDLDLDFEKKSKTFRKEQASFSHARDSLNLEDLIGEVGEPFHEVLFDRIAQSGMTDVEVYRRANMDRKLFSKIRNNPAYTGNRRVLPAVCETDEHREPEAVFCICCSERGR